MAQFDKNSQSKLSNNSSIHEVNMLATKDGEVVSINNPLPVTVDPEHAPSAFASFDNYDDAGSNIGWNFQDDWIALFGLRVKPDSGKELHLLDFSITLNGGTSVVAGYRWHMNPTLDSAYSWTDLGSTGVQYVKFDDIDGTPNEITSYPSTMVHSRTLVGKSTSDLTPEMKKFPFTDGGIEMFLEVRRLDGGATQDLFYHATVGID